MRYLSILLLLASPVLAPPALADPLAPADPAVLRQGEEVFVEYCAACHGLHGLGGNGPDIQGSIPSDIHEAIKGTDQMPEMFLEPGEPEAIAAYLMSLSPKVAETKLRLEAARKQGRLSR